MVLQQDQLILEIGAIVTHHLLIGIRADRHFAHHCHRIPRLGYVLLIGTKGEQNHYHNGNNGYSNEDHPPLSLGFLAEPYFRDLYELQRAIQKASSESLAPLTKLRRRIKALGDVELKPKPLLDGHDLIRLGAVPGPALGQLAEEMYIAQLEGTLRTKPQAKKWAQNWLKKHKW